MDSFKGSRTREGLECPQGDAAEEGLDRGV